MKPVAEDRLPPVTAAVMLELNGLEVMRDLFGMHNCRDRVVGPRRKKLGKFPTEKPAPDDMQVLVRDQARALLYEVCRVCPFKGCKMKEW